MQSGALDHLYEVLQRTATKDSAGQRVWEWSKIAEFYGELVPVSVANFSTSGAVGSALVAQVNYRPDDCLELKSEHLLRDVDTQALYAITGILPVSSAKHRIMCTVGKID